GRQLEPPVPHIYRLNDKIAKELVLHRNLCALLFFVRAKDAFQIAGAARLDVKHVGLRRHEFTTQQSIKIDLKGRKNILGRFGDDSWIHCSNAHNLDDAIHRYVRV
ncbi:MAG TPA: hypothetical protein VKD19_04020, partial [Pseudolabrys sp.]|nr:hypothetical protein [Pseudolabrys sp.]